MPELPSTQYDLSQLKKVGDDVYVSTTVIIRHPEGVEIGNHVAIDEFFVAATQLVLGDYIHIAPHVAVIGTSKGLLRMGNFTNISVGGRVVCCSDAFKGEGLIGAPGIPPEYCDRLILEPVVFEDFANTGANVTILPGVTLPQGVVIGACSLVRKSDQLKPWTIYAGNPLRELGLRPSERMFANAKALGY